MPTSFIEDSTLTAIADAIRGKNGSSDTYTPLQMVTAIQDISVGGSEPDYLHFIANKSGASINIIGTVNSGYTGDLLNIEYSTDKVDWTMLEFTTTEGVSVSDTITFTNAGDIVYFRGVNPYGTMKGDYFTSGTFDYWYTFGSVSGTADTNEFTVRGDLGTIKDKNGQNKNGGCYMLLFSDRNFNPSNVNYRITSAPYLSSTTFSGGMYYAMFAFQDKLYSPAPMPMIELSDLPLTEYGAFIAMYANCTSLSNSITFQKFILPANPEQEDIMKFYYNFQMMFYGSNVLITDDNGLTLMPFKRITFPISFMGDSMSSFSCAKEMLGSINGFELVTIHGYCNEPNAFGNINTEVSGMTAQVDYDGGATQQWVESGGSTVRFIANPVDGYTFVKWQKSNDGGTTWVDASTSINAYTETFNSVCDFYVKMIVTASS